MPVCVTEALWHRICFLCLNFKQNFLTAELKKKKGKKKKKAMRDNYEIIANYANVLKLCYSFSPGHFISHPHGSTGGGENLPTAKCSVSWRTPCPERPAPLRLRQEAPVNSRSRVRAHTRRSGALSPSALTFINLINASGVFCRSS